MLHRNLRARNTASGHSTLSRHRVAVYGSLKRGFYNHHFLQKAVFEGEAQTAPVYTMVDLGDYPGVLSGGRTCIQVEVYRVSPWLLAQLDRLETVPRVYTRTTITLPNWSQAYFYRLNSNYLRELGPGRWRTISTGNWR